MGSAATKSILFLTIWQRPVNIVHKYLPQAADQFGEVLESHQPAEKRNPRCVYDMTREAEVLDCI